MCDDPAFVRKKGFTRVKLESATKPNRNSSEQRKQRRTPSSFGSCSSVEFSSKHIVSDSLRREDPRGAFQVKSSVWC